jgi:hypothetical protein
MLVDVSTVKSAFKAYLWVSEFKQHDITELGLQKVIPK